MNVKSLSNTSLAWGWALVFLMLINCLIYAQQPSPEALRDKASQYEMKARDLKAEGRHDEARKLMQEVEVMRDKAQQIESGVPPERLESPNAAQSRRELKQRREQLLFELEELRAAGNEAEAVKLKEKILQIERQLEKRPASENIADLAKRKARRQVPARLNGPMPEIEQRMEHVQTAIGHLHAAGLHDIAERLQQDREQIRRRFEAERRIPNQGPDGMFEIEELREQIRELRQAVKELHRRLDETNQSE